MYIVLRQLVIKTDSILYLFVLLGLNFGSVTAEILLTLSLCVNWMGGCGVHSHIHVNPTKIMLFVT